MKTPLLIIILLLTIQIFIQADIRYVSKTGSSTPPYMSWETAADSIQKCLNICDNGDTVYVGNGIYHENLIFSKAINLIGMSIDSTTIDGTELGDLTISSPDNVSFSIKSFTLIGLESQNSVIVFCRSVLNINNCKLKNSYVGIYARSGGYFHDLFITDVRWGIEGGCVYDTCHFNIENNILLFNREHSVAITNNIGGYYTIRNNWLIFNHSYYLSWEGIQCIDCHRIEATNNIISGFNDAITIDVIDTAYLYNNIITKAGGIALLLQNKTIVKNSIFFNNNVVLSAASNQSPVTDYNLFWNNKVNIGYGSTFSYGDSDKVVYPMLIKDTRPDPSFTFDFHLQKYSPAIDKGDPSILDIDGSRSDIGAYGGIYGEVYDYKDLAPMAPKNLTATVDSGDILLKWNRNLEADTTYYSIYMDSTENFIIDSTKLLAKTADTLFSYLSPQANKPYYIKITATDKQDNESLPSEELYILINAIGEEYPRILSSYQLYNNYPNPFNPSTTISYRLKERGYVKLLVYDIKGELIKVLVNKEHEAGYYETEFNGSGLASGIYIYRIEVIGKGSIPVYSDMKKTILLK